MAGRDLPQLMKESKEENDKKEKIPEEIIIAITKKGSVPPPLRVETVDAMVRDAIPHGGAMTVEREITTRNKVLKIEGDHLHPLHNHPPLKTEEDKNIGKSIIIIRSDATQAHQREVQAWTVDDDIHKLIKSKCILKNKSSCITERNNIG